MERTIQTVLNFNKKNSSKNFLPAIENHGKKLSLKKIFCENEI